MEEAVSTLPLCFVIVPKVAALRSVSTVTVLIGLSHLSITRGFLRPHNCYRTCWNITARNNKIFSRMKGQFAIFELPFISVSEPVFIGNHSYENVFRLRVHFHANQKVLHVDSFLKQRELRNGALRNRIIMYNLIFQPVTARHCHWCWLQILDLPAQMRC